MRISHKGLDAAIGIVGTLTLWMIGGTGLYNGWCLAVKYKVGDGPLDWICGAAVLILMIAAPLFLAAMWRLRHGQRD